EAGTGPVVELAVGDAGDLARGRAAVADEVIGQHAVREQHTLRRWCVRRAGLVDHECLPWHAGRARNHTGAIRPAVDGRRMAAPGQRDARQTVNLNLTLRSAWSGVGAAKVFWADGVEELAELLDLVLLVVRDDQAGLGQHVLLGVDGHADPQRE